MEPEALFRTSPGEGARLRRPGERVTAVLLGGRPAASSASQPGTDHAHAPPASFPFSLPAHTSHYRTIRPRPQPCHGTQLPRCPPLSCPHFPLPTPITSAACLPRFFPGPRAAMTTPAPPRLLPPVPPAARFAGRHPQPPCLLLCELISSVESLESMHQRYWDTYNAFWGVLPAVFRVLLSSVLIIYICLGSEYCSSVSQVSSAVGDGRHSG